MPEGEVRTTTKKEWFFVRVSGIGEVVLCRNEMYRGGICPMSRRPQEGQMVVVQELERGINGLFSRNWHFADEDKNFHAEVQAPLCNGNGYRKGKKGKKIRRSKQ